MTVPILVHPVTPCITAEWALNHQFLHFDGRTPAYKVEST